MARRSLVVVAVAAFLAAAPSAAGSTTNGDAAAPAVLSLTNSRRERRCIGTRTQCTIRNTHCICESIFWVLAGSRVVAGDGSKRRSGILWRPLQIMNGKSTLDTPPIQSLDRGLAILEAVAASAEPVPLKHLTDLIGIDRSSVFRLANTLRQRRFLANPQGSKDYILGPTAWRLSRRYGRTVLGTFFHQYLRDLATDLGETSHFAIFGHKAR